MGLRRRVELRRYRDGARRCLWNGSRISTNFTLATLLMS